MDKIIEIIYNQSLKETKNNCDNYETEIPENFKDFLSEFLIEIIKNSMFPVEETNSPIGETKFLKIDNDQNNKYELSYINKIYQIASMREKIFENDNFISFSNILNFIDNQFKNLLDQNNTFEIIEDDNLLIDYIDKTILSIRQTTTRRGNKILINKYVFDKIKEHVVLNPDITTYNRNIKYIGIYKNTVKIYLDDLSEDKQSIYIWYSDINDDCPIKLIYYMSFLDKSNNYLLNRYSFVDNNIDEGLNPISYIKKLDWKK